MQYHRVAPNALLPPILSPQVSKTPNAENPWVHGATPILTMDVW